MKKGYLIIVLLLSISSYLNFYSDWSFLLNIEIVSFVWLLFYTLIFPITLIKYVYKNCTELNNFIKNGLTIIILYSISIFSSSLNFFDIKNFQLSGDGASKFVIEIILTTSFLSILSSFLYYLIKKQANSG